jgi:hypothetical protein
MHPEALRELLDDRGILRPGALPAPSPRDALAVFAQRERPSFDEAAWSRQAEQFFGATIGLTIEKRYRGPLPDEDAAGIVLHRRDGSGAPASVRLVFARPAEGADYDEATRVDAMGGSSGLGELARRCEYVYLVECEPPSGATSAASDRDALHLAAILCSVLLGPILSPDGEIFGVKTARERLASWPW